MLYGQGYGYARIQNAKNALELIEKVQKESISPGQPYIHISDYSNLRGNSPEARRLFIDGFKNNDQLVVVILLGLTPILNLSVRLARRLDIIKYKVHIAKSYTDDELTGLCIRSYAPGMRESLCGLHARFRTFYSTWYQ